MSKATIRDVQMYAHKQIRIQREVFKRWGPSMLGGIAAGAEIRALRRMLSKIELIEEVRNLPY